jgi:hypothetical protein
MSDLPQSGEKKTFATGAQRDGDEGRGMYHLIPPDALRALAKRFEDGAKAYGDNNWHQGFPLGRLLDSMNRHLLALAEGDDSEDHAAAIMWNATAWIWTEKEIKEGRLPAELDNRPYYKKPSGE